jgi:methylenetetrahydrofolate dehydrogenase (NADP+)/methenyltetrahydrofolate cyclohydrolase
MAEAPKPKALLIDGKSTAADLRVSLARRTKRLQADHGITPGIAMILVGDDPASHVYVRSKARHAAEVGFHAEDVLLPAETTEDELLERVAELNADDSIHGFLVQLPLPDQIRTERVIDAVDPAKDADGYHVINTGLLALGRAGVIPATPLGCLALLRQVHRDMTGLEAVVIGRSNTVGKPMAHLLLKENCTVTVCHSRTRKLDAIARSADILVAAVGRPNMVRGDWIKDGATIIDVGINRIEGPDGKPMLVGDVEFHEAVFKAGAITPVPGGVGPMTIAMLLQNTLALACRRAGVPIPKDE